MDQASGLSKTNLTSTPTHAAVRAGTDRSIEEIRQNIEQTRSEITDTVDQLGEKLKESVDWRSYVSDYPIIAVGGAALLGFYLTRKLLTPKRSTTDELFANLLKTTRDALVPQRKSVFITVLGLAGKYAYDQFQKYQEEQEQQRQLEEQLQALQLHQQLLGQQDIGTSQTANLPMERQRAAGTNF